MRDKAQKELTRLEKLMTTIGNAMALVFETLEDLRREVGSAEKGIVKVHEAARMMGVHPNTIRRMLKAGKLVPANGATGHLIGVTEASIADYLKL